MDFRFTPEQEALRKEFEIFFKEQMKNAPQGFETSFEARYYNNECWEFQKQMAKKLGAKGWLSRAWPKEYGGRNAPLIEQFIFREVIGYYALPGVDPLTVDMLAPTLLVTGNEEQKREHLPYIARGERFWCQLWSEPNTGSDLASLTTRAAVRDEDDYVINGQKIWTTGGHLAEWANILVRTNPNEKRGRGLSFFLMDMKSPGITVRPVLYMDGSHMLNEIFLDNVRIPARNMVGKENDGWRTSQSTSNFERSMVVTFSFLRREWEDLSKLCKESKWGGEVLAEKPLVRARLADLAIEIDVGHAFCYLVVG